MSFDLEWVRSQFPSLSKTGRDGKRAVFFDGPGGTQVPRQVIESITTYLSDTNANSGGAFQTSRETDRLIQRAHEAIGSFLGADADEIVFGANMTTLTFALSRAIARDLIPGDEIIVTRLDHDANVAPWVALSEKGVVVRFLDINPIDCTLNMEEFKQMLNHRTRLVAVGYASNAVGTINDVQTIVRLAHGLGALCFVDAVHYAPHGPIDVRQLDCDFLACSVYKFFGPHLGVLFAKRTLLEKLLPYKVRPATNQLPYRWETGTQNHEGMAGTVAAIEYLSALGEKCGATTDMSERAKLLTAMNAIRMQEKLLSEKLLTMLAAVPGITIYGITSKVRFDWRTPTVALRLQGISPQRLSERLGEQGIYTWDGNYYAIGLTERLGIENDGGMVRIGLVHYNTAEEIEALSAVLSTIRSSTTAGAL